MISIWSGIVGVLVFVLIVTIVLWMISGNGQKGKWTPKQKESIQSFISINSCPSGRDDELKSCVMNHLSTNYNYNQIQMVHKISQDIHNFTQSCLPICHSTDPQSKGKMSLFHVS